MKQTQYSIISCFEFTYSLIFSSSLYFENKHDQLYNYSLDLSNAKIAADCGNVDAINKCYIMISNGKCVDRNYDDELKYCKMAAENNHVEGINSCGCLLHDAHKIDNDFHKPLQFFKKSAEYFFFSNSTKT